MRMKNTLLLLSLMFAVSCVSEEKGHQEGQTIKIFETEIPIGKLLYKHDKPKGTIFGDGFFARIASVDKKTLDDFVKNHVEKDPLWKKGSIDKKGLEAIDFIKEWMAVDGLLSDIYKIVNLDKLAKSTGIYYRVEDIQYRPDKTTIINATVYIIDPDNNMIIILCEDT